MADLVTVLNLQDYWTRGTNSGIRRSSKTLTQRAAETYSSMKHMENEEGDFWNLTMLEPEGESEW